MQCQCAVCYPERENRQKFEDLTNEIRRYRLELDQIYHYDESDYRTQRIKELNFILAGLRQEMFGQ